MRRPRQFAVLLCATLALAGCGRSGSYRYKLTLSVDTPEGVKTGSSVSEVTIREIFFPVNGAPVTVSGEALYLDLGLGRRPLIALLHDPCPHYACWERRNPLVSLWSFDSPTYLLAKLNGYKASGDLFDLFATLRNPREPAELQPTDLPLLATFEDVNDPNRVLRVDPNDIAATFGNGIQWRKITIETTNEPITVDFH